jgi:hypothetical protein
VGVGVGRADKYLQGSKRIDVCALFRYEGMPRNGNSARIFGYLARRSVADHPTGFHDQDSRHGVTILEWSERVLTSQGRCPVTGLVVRHVHTQP